MKEDRTIRPLSTMEKKLSFEELRGCSREYDTLALATPGIDVFCSSSIWGLSAVEAFYPDARSLVMRTDRGFLGLILYRIPGMGLTIMPLEASWCLASPFIGPDIGELVDLLYKLARGMGPRWDALFLAGLTEKSPLWQRLIGTFYVRYGIFSGPKTLRRIASLEGGLDGFLARRTSKFRNNLRRDQRAVADLDITFTHWDGIMSSEAADALFLRMMEVEARSWKGLQEQGVNEGGMFLFYREMLKMLGPVGQLRAIMACKGGRDVGYIFGAVMGKTYRGLQFSFLDNYSRLGLGNVLQLEMIKRLCLEGIDRYDLGTEMEYKSRWAEIGLETASIVVRP